MLLPLLALLAPALALPRPRDSIVGGEEAVPHSIPWQVSLRRKSDDFHFCGGSVGGPNHIITAAHCSVIWDSATEVEVVAGGHNNAIPDGMEQRVSVSKIQVHEDYNPYKNDIAIWVLGEPLVMDERVQAVPLPTKLQESTGSCNVSGWGTLTSGGHTPDKLMVVSVPVVTDAICRIEYPFQIADSMICAGEHGKDSCQGDSGGPMVCYNADGSGYLGGIVSWGIGCGGYYHPGVYTEVSYFVDWIEANTPAPATTTTAAPTTTTPAPTTTTTRTPAPSTTTYPPATTTYPPNTTPTAPPATTTYTDTPTAPPATTTYTDTPTAPPATTTYPYTPTAPPSTTTTYPPATTTYPPTTTAPASK